MMTIDLNRVVHVYSGKDGKCCCGCAGKHTYASKFRDWSTKDRGYAIQDEEVNDRAVKTIVNKMNRLFQTGTPADNIEPGFVSVVVGSRLYVAYFKKD